MSATVTEEQSEPPASADIRESAQLPRAVWLFWIVSLMAFVLTLVVSIAEFHAGYEKARWFPLSDPLLGDLMEYPGTYQLLHTGAFFDNHSPHGLPPPIFSAVAYPPFAAALLAPVYLLASPVWTFLAMASSTLAFAFWGVRRALVRVGMGSAPAIWLPLTLTLVSFPIERLVHQGNVELLVWVFAAAGTWAFLRGQDDVAAVLWGLAAAMKLYPILFLLLLLPRRRYRAFLFGVGVFVAATVVSLWWLGPSMGVAWQGSLRNVFGYQSLRVSEWSLRELVANHSLFELVKLAAMMAHISLAKLTLPYYACGGVLMLWAFFGRLRKMPVANQILAVTIAMLLLPTISYYHTLIHLYAPLLMLVFLAIRAQKEGMKVRGLQFTLLLFVPLFVPYTLLTFPNVFLFCGMVQSVVLVLVFLCALEFPFDYGELPGSDVRANALAMSGFER